jgi:hypothetical protein
VDRRASPQAAGDYWDFIETTQTIDRFTIKHRQQPQDISAQTQRTHLFAVGGGIAFVPSALAALLRHACKAGRFGRIGIRCTGGYEHFYAAPGWTDGFWESIC